MVDAGAAEIIQQANMTNDSLASHPAAAFSADRDALVERARQARSLAMPDSLLRITNHCLAAAGGDAMIQRMRRINCVHFIGIGGSGMSGIAEVMLSLGYVGAGFRPEARNKPQSKRLEAQGATCLFGHDAAQHRCMQMPSSFPARSMKPIPEVVAARDRLLALSCSAPRCSPS